eukprot:788515_1
MTPVTRIAYFVFAALLLLDSSAGEQEVRTYDVLMDGPNVSIEGRTTSASPNFSFKIRIGTGVQYISVGSVCPENSSSHMASDSFFDIPRALGGRSQLNVYKPSDWLERTPGDESRCGGWTVLPTLRRVSVWP